MRKYLAAITMTLVLMVGTTFAGNGLLVSDIAGAETTPCTQPEGGIYPIGFAGIYPIGFTGIIVFTEKETPTDCGIYPIG
ncbi:MAG TPA: hypothetical protein PKY59_24395 [Pyrinomonadaceae bacterium]|nr:hypothetical protein [Pyrinomonadaceae bacterium]